MANEKRVRNNNVQGTLSSTMNSTGTTMNSAGLANLEAISSTEHAAIIIDPGRTAGAPEIVHVTAHTGSATSATISRAKEGTSARAHSSTEEWVHAPTATIDYLPFRPPSVKVSRDAALSIGSGAWEEITFDTETRDTDTMWSSTAATKVFANTAGEYLVIGHGGLASSTLGIVRTIGIRFNSTAGSPVARSGFVGDLSTDFTPDLHISDIVSMTTGQFVQLVFFQDSGGTLAISTATDTQPKLRMIWMSS